MSTGTVADEGAVSIPNSGRTFKVTSEDLIGSFRGSAVVPFTTGVKSACK